MMFSAASTMTASTEVARCLDSPREYYNSPSSISDVDLTRRADDKIEQTARQPDSPSVKSVVSTECSAVRETRDAETGDESETPQGDMRALPPTSGTDDINEPGIAHPISSPLSCKRKIDDGVEGAEGEGEDHERLAKKLKTLPSTENGDRDDEPASKEAACGDCRMEAADREGPCDDGYGGGDVDCSLAALPRRPSRRTLYIEYWSRTDECKERKWDHLDEIADKYGSAEEHIFATTLKGTTACLEPNMFPYDTPAGIEHWTLWHMKELNHEQVKQYVEGWIDTNAPNVENWNYDDNPERSIDIFHVHVYFQVPEGQSVLHGRKVEDLLHELD